MNCFPADEMKIILREPCNRKNEWKFKFTFYGFCLEFNNDTDADILKKISVGRQTSLRIDIRTFPAVFSFYMTYSLYGIGSSTKKC